MPIGPELEAVSHADHPRTQDVLGSELADAALDHHLDAKRRSREAHASQTTGADPGAGMNVRTLAAFLSLPSDLFALAFSTEWYVRRGAEPGAREDDVFSACGGG